MRKGWASLIIFLIIFCLAWTAYGADYGKLLSKSCYPATYRGHQVEVCYFKYEKADVWTRDGQVYAYRPITEKERKELKKLSDWSPTEKGLWYGFLGLQAADVGTTAFGTLSGRCVEMNPLLGWAFRSSTWLGLGVGAVGKVGYSILLKGILNKNPKPRRATLTIANGVSALTVLWNLLVIVGLL